MHVHISSKVPTSPIQRMSILNNRVRTGTLVLSNIYRAELNTHTKSSVIYPEKKIKSILYRPDPHDGLKANLPGDVTSEAIDEGGNGGWITSHM